MLSMRKYVGHCVFEYENYNIFWVSPTKTAEWKEVDGFSFFAFENRKQVLKTKKLIIRAW